MNLDFGYICSNITSNDINPSFSTFYGSVNGISEKYHFDITEEYEDLKNEKWFHRNLGKLFSIDMYVDSGSESDSDSDSDSESNKSLKSNESLKSDKSDKSNNSLKSYNSSYHDSDYVCILKGLPVQLFFIEKLDGTLEDFLKVDVHKDLILSCLLQVTFALHLLQKKFTPNSASPARYLVLVIK